MTTIYKVIYFEFFGFPCYRTPIANVIEFTGENICLLLAIL